MATNENMYVPGDPWCICDICGFKTRMSRTRKTWDGLRVCIPDWYPRHPQLDVKGKKDRQAVPDARPEPPDVFILGGGGYLISPYLEEPMGYLGPEADMPYTRGPVTPEEL